MAAVEVRRTTNPYTGLPELEICRTVQVEPDPCLVETAPIAASLLAFVEGWRKKRPSTAGRFRADDSGDVDPLSPYQSLAFDTGLSEQEIRRVRSPDKYPHVEMRVVDALVAAGVGDPMIFHDPTFRIVQNPRSTRPCDCGGST